MTEIGLNPNLIAFYVFAIATIGIIIAILVKTKSDTKTNISSITPEEKKISQDRLSESEEKQPDTLISENLLDVDIPQPVSSRFSRLKQRLANSKSPFQKGILDLLSKDNITQEIWDDIEENLLSADMGAEATDELLEALQTKVKVLGNSKPEELKIYLKEELIRIIDPNLDRSLNLETKNGNPAIILVVGVNGVGKTTTVGKLARILVAENKTTILGAADTFRAAAAEQLTTWGSRVGIETVKAESSGADPASVAFEAVKVGIEKQVDTILVDTAGRLQNKTGLMDELGKVKRVIEKQAPVSEVLLVLDASTGQNGLQQAKVFSEAVDVTGIVLTKFDGTAKGGVVIPIQKDLGVPVKFIGLGEGVDDLAPFVVEEFVAALLE